MGIAAAQVYKILQVLTFFSRKYPSGSWDTYDCYTRTARQPLLPFFPPKGNFSRSSNKSCFVPLNAQVHVHTRPTQKVSLFQRFMLVGASKFLPEIKLYLYICKNGSKLTITVKLYQERFCMFKTALD